MRQRVGAIVVTGLLATGGTLGCSTSPAPPPSAEAEVDSPARRDAPLERSPGTQDASARAFPTFSGTVSRIGPRLEERMRFTHRRGCPVGLRDLRYLQLSFVGFGGGARTGEMVVRRSQARAVVGVFRRLYDRRWPIRRMRLVDDYRGSDGRSMSANNTSGYNCRRIAGGDQWSEHSFGRAIDINPVQNPYVGDDFVVPEEGRRFARVDRSRDARPRRGVVHSRDVVVRAFDRIGWEWGGYWVNSKDYQHFSATGG